MTRHFIDALAAFFLLAVTTACVSLEDSTELPPETSRQYGFDITVTRDGKEIPQERYGVMTKGGDESFDQFSTMDPDRSFGLIGVNAETGEMVIDNQQIFSMGSGYSWVSDNVWDDPMLLSAYYPYKKTVTYKPEDRAYTIRFSTDDTDAGPLVSNTMRQAIDKINRIPLEFQHITNDLGFKVCDVTPTEVLQGLIHLRKVIAHNVASAGFFVNELERSTGSWQSVGYYRDVVVFEGDVKVGVGSENEKFIGYDTLEDHLADSHRFYAVPDEIRLGTQYVEVVYDVEPFTIEGFTYPPVKNHVSKFALYGLLPDNVFVYGKQYTFHIGLDLSTLYHEITFAPTVSDWETKIYENNEDF